MRFGVLASLLMLAPAGCCHMIEPSPEPLYKFASGISHGECIGYCRMDMTVIDSSVRMTWKAQGRGGLTLPDSLRSGSISKAELSDLLSATDWRTITALDTVYGCPDCADQGAEYVEVTRGGVTRRITFDPMLGVPQIQDLINRLRAIRARYGS